MGNALLIVTSPLLAVIAFGIFVCSLILAGRVLAWLFGLGD